MKHLLIVVFVLLVCGAPPASASSPFEDAIERWSESIDPFLIRAVIRIESNFAPRAVSPKGAQGLMQLMPGTARLMGVRRPFDPEENIRGGVLYLKQQIDRFGRVDHALAAYNAGPEAVNRYGGIPPFRETRDYVRKVLAEYARLRGEGFLGIDPAAARTGSIGGASTTVLPRIVTGSPGSREVDARIDAARAAIWSSGS